MNLDKPHKLTKVNIGCGPQGRSDWINLDWGVLPLLSKLPLLRRFLIGLHLLPKSYSTPWPDNLRLRDCRRKLPVLDSSVDYLYTSHFLEHLPRYQAIKFLSECRRVLKPSGVLRISVPDIKELAEKYLQADADFFSRLDGSEGDSLKSPTDKFLQHLYGYDCWSEPTFAQKLQRRFIRGHLWMYDYGSLNAILTDLGFSTVKRCQAGQGQVPDIDYLDIHQIGSLFVEASKSPGP